jgi:hypothetical protein
MTIAELLENIAEKERDIKNLENDQEKIIKRDQERAIKEWEKNQKEKSMPVAPGHLARDCAGTPLTIKEEVHSDEEEYCEKVLIKEEDIAVMKVEVTPTSCGDQKMDSIDQ